MQPIGSMRARKRSATPQCGIGAPSRGRPIGGQCSRWRGNRSRPCEQPAFRQSGCAGDDVGPLPEPTGGQFHHGDRYRAGSRAARTAGANTRVLFAFPGVVECSCAGTARIPVPAHMRCGSTVATATGIAAPQRRKSISIRPSRQAPLTASVTTRMTCRRLGSTNVAGFRSSPSVSPYVSDPRRMVRGFDGSIEASTAGPGHYAMPPVLRELRNSTKVRRHTTIDEDVSTTSAKSSQGAGGRRTGSQIPPPLPVRQQRWSTTKDVWDAPPLERLKRTRERQLVTQQEPLGCVLPSPGDNQCRRPGIPLRRALLRWLRFLGRSGRCCCWRQSR